MAIRPFLAMTAAEFRANPHIPPRIAWMASHFSPYCTGLSNLPKTLPPDSLLILDDITPIHGHDPERIAAQLRERVEALNCSGVLLDFQRPEYKEAAALARYLTENLPCPVAVSDIFAGELDCPVFLSPVPPDMPLSEYLAPWSGRQVWLEMARNGTVITLTDEGAAAAPLPPGEHFEGGHLDAKLHCHYRIKLSEEQARFTLYRTMDDLNTLLEEAESLGVTHGIGLYQELYDENDKELLKIPT